MKLSMKITVLAAIIIALAVGGCCTMVISFSAEGIFSQVKERGIYDIKNFAFSLRDALSSDTWDEITEKSCILYHFNRLTGSHEYTLYTQDGVISNNAGFLAQAEGTERFDVFDHRDGNLKRIEFEGKSYLYAECGFEVRDIHFSLCLVRDITETADGIRALAVKCALGGVFIMLAAAMLMMVMVTRSLSQVKKLRKQAHELAGGRYDERIDIKGKDELAEFAADFNLMADAVEHSIRELREKNFRQRMFISDLSHEMKTPVTAILISSETLLMRKVPPETEQRILKSIYDGAGWLERLSRKLMTLVMVQGAAELHPYSVEKLFDQVRDTMEQSLAREDIRLKTECGIKELLMDEDLMRSALVNLVENAKRASRRGQSIELRAYSETIEVRDSGCGIPAEEAERIAEPFYTVDRSRSKKNGGIGLGLALVKSIAEAHGARLEIESEPGRGTVMRMVFSIRQT